MSFPVPRVPSGNTIKETLSPMALVILSMVACAWILEGPMLGDLRSTRMTGKTLEEM
jgi:hypothetical protein